MAQGATLQFYNSDEFSSFAEAKEGNGCSSVYLDYANDDTMQQTAVWDALEIIHAALQAVGKGDVKLRYVLTRDGQILDC